MKILCGEQPKRYLIFKEANGMFFRKSKDAKGMVLEKSVCQRHGFRKVSMPAAYERIERNDL